MLVFLSTDLASLAASALGERGEEREREEESFPEFSSFFFFFLIMRYFKNKINTSQKQIFWRVQKAAVLKVVKVKAGLLSSSHQPAQPARCSCTSRLLGSGYHFKTAETLPQRSGYGNIP